MKLAITEGRPWTYSELADAVGMSASEAHGAVKRARLAGLIAPDELKVRRANLLEFLVHGVKYAFPCERGGVTRGMLTAHAAPPLAAEIVQGELPPVWPDPHGTARGEALKPLYRSAVAAARQDDMLYACLALIDAIRAGRARERKLAERHLRDMLAP